MEGIKGDKGLPGPPGDQGMIGDQGMMGDKGDIGPVGPTGDVGPPGVTGDKGDQGQKGDMGDKGQKGELGMKGDVGEQGMRGDMGDKGTKGLIGPMGDKGDNGTIGPKGDMGDTGDKGDMGIEGIVGEQGPRGPPGDIGGPGKEGDRGCSLAKVMVSPAQMQDSDGDGDGDENRPQIGSVGFIIGTRSLCVYTPLGWIDVESGDSATISAVRGRRETKVRRPHDVVALTPSNVQKFRRHLVPLVPLLKSLGGGDLQLPDPVCGDGIREEREECDGTDLGDITCPQHHGNMYIGSPRCTASCQLDMSHCQPLTLLLFVMSSAVDGMMTIEDHVTSQLINGTSRADLLCQKDAERAGLSGSYSALLSTKKHPLQNITTQQYRHLPVVNTMGHIVSSTWEDLVRWRLRDSPLLTLEGDDIRKGQW
jgi:hypothetical protein